MDKEHPISHENEQPLTFAQSQKLREEIAIAYVGGLKHSPSVNTLHFKRIGKFLFNKN